MLTISRGVTNADAADPCSDAHMLDMSLVWGTVTGVCRTGMELLFDDGGKMISVACGRIVVVFFDTALMGVDGLVSCSNADAKFQDFLAEPFGAAIKCLMASHEWLRAGFRPASMATKPSANTRSEMGLWV